MFWFNWVVNFLLIPSVLCLWWWSHVMSHMHALTVQALWTGAAGVMCTKSLDLITEGEIWISGFLREFIINYCFTCMALEMICALEMHTRILCIVSGCPEERGNLNWMDSTAHSKRRKVAGAGSILARQHWKTRWKSWCIISWRGENGAASRVVRWELFWPRLGGTMRSLGAGSSSRWWERCQRSSPIAIFIWWLFC